jgi:plasmid stabilization system protein ParE
VDAEKTRSRARLSWTRAGKRSLKQLLRYLETTEYGDPVARVREIAQVVRKLTYLPSRYPVIRVRNGKAIRRVVVSGRFLVFYIHFPPRGVEQPGRVSIRAVKHGARKNPLAGVRDTDEAMNAGYLGVT